MASVIPITKWNGPSNRMKLAKTWGRTHANADPIPMQPNTEEAILSQ